MNWLNLNGISYSYNQLLEGKFPKGNTDFEQATLSFCHDWLNGILQFHFQSSGSTGIPKLISFQRSQIEASIHRSQQVLKYKKNETALVCLDTRYIAGQMMLARSLFTEMNIIAVEPSANPFKNLKETPIHFAALVPFQLQEIIDSPQLEFFNQIDTKIIGGAPLNENTERQLIDLPGKIYATYGMTETLTHIALRKLNIPGLEDHYTALPETIISVDERNCLKIDLPKINVYNIVTNDIVKLVGPAQFLWLGRYDNIINSGGIKIIPEEIERTFAHVMNEMNLHHRFIATGISDEKLGDKLILICEGALSEENKKDLLEKAGHRLHKYELPKEIIAINSFIETASGKINRSKTTIKATLTS